MFLCKQLLPELRHHRGKTPRCSSEILKSAQWESKPLGPMEQGEALQGFERMNKPAEQWVGEKKADALSQGQKIRQDFLGKISQGPCRMDVDVTEESPSPRDGQQRGIFGVLMKKETENITPHLATRTDRGFGVGGAT